MRILFDQGVPVPMKQFLRDHVVQTCYERGWSAYSNGELIDRADIEYDVLVTTDKNLRYQQNLIHRKISIFVLPTTRWPILRPFGQSFAAATNELTQGDYVEWSFPD